MVISLRRSNVSGSPQIYVINTYAKIRSRNQTDTLSLRTYNVVEKTMYYVVATFLVVHRFT